MAYIPKPGTVTLLSGCALGVAMPWLATAGAISVIVGGVLGLSGLVDAAYNCGTHWSDEEDGKKAVDSVKDEIQKLIQNYCIPLFQTSSYSGSSSKPSAPSSSPWQQENPRAWQEAIHNERQQAIYRQRGNPSDFYPTPSLLPVVL